MKFSVLTLMAIAPLATVCHGQSIVQNRAEFFEGHVRPILVNQCYGCHAKGKLGGLSLESREDLLRGGQTGPAVVPGEPDKSLLIQAIRQQTDLKMPKGGKLSAAEVADLVQWVKDGAYWPAPERTKGEPTKNATAAPKAPAYVITAEQRRFWSFQPLHSAAPPIVHEAAWPRNEIDRFLLARLEKEGLKVAPDADRRTLLRRVTYDLTGLMPTYDEVRAFEADPSPNAYEKVVDRLIASPHFGERFGRFWLDVVRYSEDNYRTPGMNVAPDRTERFPFAFEYRDWVIDAINRDMPFDLFVKAQLAADQMQGKDRDKYIPALGMNGLGVWHWDANPPEVERADEWNDRVDTTTRAFLGLTVACARCHDHKYDPIPQRDYYRLASVFASTDSHSYPLVDKSVVEDYDQKSATLKEKTATLDKFLADASELHARTVFTRTEDYMVTAWKLGTTPSLDLKEAAAQNGLDETALRRWVRFLRKPPVNYSYLKDWQTMVAHGGTEADARKLASAFYATAKEVVATREALIKENAALQPSKGGGGGGKGGGGGGMDLLPNGSRRRLGKRNSTLKGLEREPGYLWKDMFQEDLPDYPLGVDSYVNGPPPPGLLVYKGKDLEPHISAEWNAHIKFLQADIEAFKKSMPPQYPYAYGLADKAEPETVKVHLRGSPYSLGDDAPRSFLSILSEGEPAEFKNGSGRLELAEDIVKQPLAQRVIVNRIWRWLMGSGLVDTPSNFGTIGDRPSNPELLEYLTTRFVAEGMSWKKLEKEIVMSRAYQLSSSMPSADARVNEEKDGGNRLYWRANRRRLESEGLWDILLEGLRQTRSHETRRTVRAPYRRHGSSRRLRQCQPHESRRLPADLGFPQCRAVQ